MAAREVPEFPRLEAIPPFLALVEVVVLPIIWVEETGMPLTNLLVYFLFYEVLFVVIDPEYLIVTGPARTLTAIGGVTYYDSLDTF